MENTVDRLYHKYAFAFENKETFKNLIGDILDLEFLSVDKDFYLGLLIEARIRKYLQDNISLKNYWILHSYINQESKRLSSKDYITFLDSIEFLLEIGKVMVSDRLLKKLLEDNVNLMNICGVVVKENKTFLKKGLVANITKSSFTSRLLYTYCDLFEIGIENNFAYYETLALPPFKSPQEENLALKRAQDQDSKALEEIILRYFRLIYKEALKYKNNYNDVEDLVQQGIIGLLYAIKNYDFTKNVNFSFYAKPWIKMFITRYIDWKSSCFRVPVNYRILYRKYVKTYDLLYQQLEREPRREEIAKALNVDVSKLDKVVKIVDFKICLDRQIAKEEVGDERIADLVSDSEIDLISDYETKEEKEIVRKIINTSNLTSREYSALMWRFGFFSSKYLPANQVAAIMGIAYQRVYQLEKTALDKLRNSRHLSEYIEGDPKRQEELAAIKLEHSLKLVSKSKK